MKIVNKKLRKRDRALNAVKSGAKRVRKISQKVQRVFNKVKPIINPCNALFGFLLKRTLKLTLDSAAPTNPLLTVSRATLSPLEIAKEAEMGNG
jgi:hypothetical protein